MEKIPKQCFAITLTSLSVVLAWLGLVRCMQYTTMHTCRTIHTGTTWRVTSGTWHHTLCCISIYIHSCECMYCMHLTRPNQAETAVMALVKWTHFRHSFRTKILALEGLDLQNTSIETLVVSQIFSVSKVKHSAVYHFLHLHACIYTVFYSRQVTYMEPLIQRNQSS